MQTSIKNVFYERLLIVLFVFATLIFSGCRPSGVAVEKVLGTVTLDGKPAIEVTVSFTAKEGKTRPAVGRTNNKGEFEMLTGGANRNGVMPGDYYVTFSKYILVTPDGQESQPFKFNPDG
jgi:5-hydroxyisourate hydrolase-like protein (transthyretin family)